MKSLFGITEFSKVKSVIISSLDLLPSFLIFEDIYNNIKIDIMYYQFSSVTQSCLTLCNSMDCSTPGLPVLHQPLSIESVMPSNHLILCCPLILLPSTFPSINESVLCIRWPKYWSFSFNISLSNEHSGLISFRMDWLDLLALQGTLKSLPQHHSSRASILWCSAFFTVQLSHPYMTTGKQVTKTYKKELWKPMRN